MKATTRSGSIYTFSADMSTWESTNEHYPSGILTAPVTVRVGQPMYFVGRPMLTTTPVVEVDFETFLGQIKRDIEGVE